MSTLEISQHGDYFYLRRVHADEKGRRSIGVFESADDALSRAEEVLRSTKINPFAEPEIRMMRDRSCICCRAVFPSHGAHNRMCEPCRRRASEIVGC